MDHTAILAAVRTWLDELAEVEDQFAWLRDVTLDRPSCTPQPRRPGEANEQGDAPPEILLLGEARGVDAEELGSRVASEPTLGGHFENATFRQMNDAGTVGILVVRPM
ncbi:MAG: hypothetical protein M3417_15750 [Actinomycetota bacterium]|nr:hypothetical protein [Actinomycetota bacterium]